jgi:hypothetical protein
MHPNLSFEQAPPVSVPFRFFLTAPLFGVAAGLLLILEGGDMLGSRWMPAALAGTHLLVAGFMLQAMCGALLQFVPVAAGGNVWHPRLVAGILHPLLGIAVILLALAFLRQSGALFIAAAYAFTIALVGMVIIMSLALWRTPGTGPTLVAMRMAMLGLLVTLGLGATLAHGLANGSSWSLPLLTDIHAAWGLGGWALLLLVGVSYYVVPMFQLTPAYPVWLARGLPPLLFGLLGVWSLPLLGIAENLRPGIFLLGLATAAAFAVVTLQLQMRRRRKVADTTLAFFRLAMLCLLATLASALVFNLFSILGSDLRAPVWLGLLTIIGVFVSAINGMLYKIVPFLCWLHLQRLCDMKTLPPTMNQMIPEVATRRQYRSHLVALGLLLLAVWVPEVARVAGLALGIAQAWLCLNLVRAVRAYLRFKDRIRAAA